MDKQECRECSRPAKAGFLRCKKHLEERRRYHVNRRVRDGDWLREYERIKQQESRARRAETEAHG